MAVHSYHDGAALLLPARWRGRFCHLSYSVVNNKDIEIVRGPRNWSQLAAINVTKLPRGRDREQRACNYSSGLKNSKPNRRISPATDCRRILAEIGGVSLGTTLDEAGDGAGTVMLTTWSGRRKCVEAIHAPVALILRVLVSSMNSTPDVSTPRRKTGTWRRIRGDWRRCSKRSPFFSI